MLLEVELRRPRETRDQGNQGSRPGALGATGAGSASKGSHLVLLFRTPQGYAGAALARTEPRDEGGAEAEQAGDGEDAPGARLRARLEVQRASRAVQ